MTAKPYLYISVILLIFMFLAVFGMTSSADTQKVHALLIILGNDRDIRPSVNVNDSNMQTLLRLLSENCEVHMTVMKSADETTGTVTEKTLANADVTAQSSPQQLGIIKANQVTAWIRNLQSNSDDTILIYYSGHGMINEDEVHILNFDPNVSNDSVTRNGLRERLRQKQGRLKMLITDTCSNQAQRSDLIAQSYGRVVPRKRRYTEDLFLKHKGFLDITAASPGQYAWGNNQIGGYFTAALIQSFTSSSDVDKDAFLSWKEAFSATRNETQRLFSETTFRTIDKRKMDSMGQTTQTPTKRDPLPVRLTQAEATLTITSTPSGAAVYLNGTRVGKTPLENYVINTGKSGKKDALVGLALAGYKSRLWYLSFERGKFRDWSSIRLVRFPDTSGVTQTIFWPEMVRIPAGEFQMGSNDSEADEEEKPVHTVYVDEFYIDKYEVTNAQYKAFIDANPQWRKDRIPREYHDGHYLWFWDGNNYPKGEPDHPVVCVSWYAAMAYAQWAGKRLPTEAEWEKAARGDLVGKVYPWGNTIDNSKANYNKTNYGNPGTTPVGKYPSNGYGLYDMSGNVHEWCLDKADGNFYANSPHENPIAGIDNITHLINNFRNVKSFRICRGGSWVNAPRKMRIAGRYGEPPMTSKYYLGFRCARDIISAPPR